MGAKIKSLKHKRPKRKQTQNLRAKSVLQSINNMYVCESQFNLEKIKIKNKKKIKNKIKNPKTTFPRLEMASRP